MKGQPRKSKGRTPSARSKTEIQKVMRLEREVWKAAREKNAGNFQKLVSADALMIFQSGILTQPDYIATMHGRTLEENTIEDLRGHMPNANTVILNLPDSSRRKFRRQTVSVHAGYREHHLDQASEAVGGDLESGNALG
jgi:hypothetical protein